MATKKYSIVFADNKGSRAVDAIAQTFGGQWSNAVSRYDGTYDKALVEVPEENVEELEEELEYDPNVISYISVA